MAGRVPRYPVTLLVLARGIPPTTGSVIAMNLSARRLKYLVRFLLAVILGATYLMIAHAETPPLSMDGAIRRAVQTNLNTQLSKATSREARGRAIQAAASLLPQVTGSVRQARVFKANLAAQGFESNSFLPNPVIGPY